MDMAHNWIQILKYDSNLPRLNLFPIFIIECKAIFVIAKLIRK